MLTLHRVPMQEVGALLVDEQGNPIHANLRLIETHPDGTVTAEIMRLDGDDVSYHPVDDEKKTFSMHEWHGAIVAALQEYLKEFGGPDTNEYHRQRHTYSEWASTFGRFMSW